MYTGKPEYAGGENYEPYDWTEDTPMAGGHAYSQPGGDVSALRDKIVAVGDALKNFQSVNKPTRSGHRQPGRYYHEVHHHHHNDMPWYMWMLMPRGGGGTVVNNYNGTSGPAQGSHSGGKREKEDNSGLVIGGLVMGVMALVASYYVGRDLSQVNQTGKAQRKVNDLGYELHSHFDLDVRNIQRLFREADTLLKDMRFDAQVRAAIKVALVATCIVGVAGAFAGSAAVVGTAAFLVFAECCGMLINYAYNSDNYKEYQQTASRLVKNSETCAAAIAA